MKLFLNIQLKDQMGNVHADMSSIVPDKVAYKGERHVDDLEFEANWLHLKSGQEAIVEAKQVKEFRREWLKEFINQAGEELIDHLENKEGWNGLDEQEEALKG